MELLVLQQHKTTIYITTAFTAGFMIPLTCLYVRQSPLKPRRCKDTLESGAGKDRNTNNPSECVCHWTGSHWNPTVMLYSSMICHHICVSDESLNVKSQEVTFGLDE